MVDRPNNPGGLLDQAIWVSDAFLERGEIVSTRGRTAEETQRFNARGGDLTKNKPVIALINSGSASASEIVAGGRPQQPPPARLRTPPLRQGSGESHIPLRFRHPTLPPTPPR